MIVGSAAAGTRGEKICGDVAREAPARMIDAPMAALRKARRETTNDLSCLAGTGEICTGLGWLELEGGVVEAEGSTGFFSPLDMHMVARRE